jgi:hypothetical protein
MSYYLDIIARQIAMRKLFAGDMDCVALGTIGTSVPSIFDAPARA